MNSALKLKQFSVEAIPSFSVPQMSQVRRAFLSLEELSSKLPHTVQNNNDPMAAMMQRQLVFDWFWQMISNYADMCRNADRLSIGLLAPAGLSTTYYLLY